MQNDGVADKVFSLLKGHVFKIKIFDENGTETVDPSLGQRFFVTRPNVMVTIDVENNSIELSKGSGVGPEIQSLQKNLKQLGDKFLMNSHIKVFGRSIQPKDYSYQVKKHKGQVMENTPIKPINSMLLGKVLHELGALGQATTASLSSALGVDAGRVQSVLNRLVKDGKVVASGSSPSGQPMYTKSMEEAITEGLSKMFGSKKTSRQTMENINIVVRHRTPVDDNVRGARTRHISAVFLEMDGQRLPMPNNNLWCARSMAQHLCHGGQMDDCMGQYILESAANLAKLQAFSKYAAANGLVNESSASIVTTIKDNISVIKEELRRMSSKRTYESVKARVEMTDRESLSEQDTSQLKELFTVKSFDQRFEDVLPIVNQMVQERTSYLRRIEEAAHSPVVIRHHSGSTSPVFEFTSEHARLAYKLSELGNRIVGNEELVEFVNTVGTKIRSGAQVDDFERATIGAVLENITVSQHTMPTNDIMESESLQSFFDAFDFEIV